MLSFEGKAEEDKRCSLAELRESLQILEMKVQEEVDFWQKQNVKGNIYKRIFVGGFSQGCAVSLLYGLTSSNIVAGVVGFSGYLFSSFDIPNLDKLPILLHHGVHDPMIPFKQATKSYEKIMKSDKITFR